MSKRLRVAIAFGLMALLVGCSGKTSPQGLVQAEYAYDFSSLKEMVATSTAIVEGTVTSVKEGDVAAVEDDVELRYMDVAVSVDSVLYGSIGEDQDTLTIQELPSVELSLTAEGSHGFFFLHQDKDTGAFVIINPEGRFTVDDDGTLSSSEPDPDEWVAAIEKETPEEFRQAIAEAVQAVEQGDASPAAPLG